MPLAPKSTEINVGTFTTDDGDARAISVENIFLQISAEDIGTFFSVCVVNSLQL
jgi:hypothetical protein